MVTDPSPTPLRASGPPDLGRFVAAVFDAWRQTGVTVVILRHSEDLGRLAEEGVALLVARTQLVQAETALLAAAHQAGFRVHNRRKSGAALALYLSGIEGGTQVHFHLLTGLRWRGFEFLDCQALLAGPVDRGEVAVPRPAHAAAASLLEGLVCRGKIDEERHSTIAAAFRAEPADALELLAGTSSPALAQSLAASAAAESWAELESRAGALRRGLILRQAVRRPFRTLARAVAEVARLASQAARPSGLTVVLCGADGSGKSTAARAIIEGLRPTFSPERGREYHWKPPLFSARRRAARGPVTDPHGKPPRSAPLSWLFFGAHWLEFLLAWPACVWPVATRGGLVLIDRFYYDFFVDQRRYRMRVPGWLVTLGYRFLPKPDLVLLLDAPAEVLQRRKAEVPMAETQRQRDAFLELVRRLPNGRVVDAAQPPEMVAAQSQRLILDLLAERLARRSGVNPP